MKRYLKAITNLVVALAVLLVVIFLVPRLLVFFAPFIVGWILSLIAAPFVRFFEEKLKIKRKTGSAVVIIVVIGLVVLFFYLVGAKLAEEAVGLGNELPEMWENMEADLNEIGRKFNVVYSRLPKNIQNSLSNVTNQIGSYLGDFFSHISSPTITAVGNFAKRVPSVIIGVIMALLSAYFFVAERDEVGQWLKTHAPESIRKRVDILKRSLVKAVGGYVKAQLQIEIWMYLLLVIGFSVLQVNYTLLIALGIAILDILPFFGTGTVMIPWAIIKILSGDYQMALGLLIIWGLGQLARQIIQPKIVGDSVGMPPIPTLLLLYIGYKISGVIGMIIAVPIGLIIATMYEEGVFDTTKNSVLILVNGINNFRKLQKEDLESITKEK